MCVCVRARVYNVCYMYQEHGQSDIHAFVSFNLGIVIKHVKAPHQEFTLQNIFEMPLSGLHITEDLLQVVQLFLSQYANC